MATNFKNNLAIHVGQKESEKVGRYMQVGDIIETSVRYKVECRIIR